MEKKNPGEFYRKKVLESGLPSAMLQTDLITYLTNPEIRIWLFLCQSANRTVFPDGSFIVSRKEIAFKTGVSEDTVKRVMKSLRVIGFIKRQMPGGPNRYELNFSSINHLGAILNKNAGIGQALRGIMDFSHIDYIRPAHVEKARKMIYEE